MLRHTLRNMAVRRIFDPNSKEPYKLSRSKVDLFIQCPKCFYLDRRQGVSQPPGFPFNLNSAVDTLLKKEFDTYRAAKKPHPLMVEAKINAIPYSHPELDTWRDALHAGIQAHHTATNLLLTGGIDDVWVTPQGELIIVDYKATAKAGEVSIDGEWQAGYKRQVEFYQWLFKQNGFKVHPTAWFVYCNGILSAPQFDRTLSFTIRMLPHTGSGDWIEPTLQAIHSCLRLERAPAQRPDCKFCSYRERAESALTRLI